DPLGAPGGAGGVAHAAWGVFVQCGIDEVRRVGGDKRLVVLVARWYWGAAGRYHDDPFDLHQRQHLLEQRQQDVVNQDDPVTRIPDDVSEVIRRQAEIERMQSRPGRRDAEVGLEVPDAVP